MSWLGVPFTSSAAWKAFKWTSVEFINQFIRAGEMRVNAMRDLLGLDNVSFDMIEVGVALQPKNQFNRLRALGNYYFVPGEQNGVAATLGNAPLHWNRWLNPNEIAVGAACDATLSINGPVMPDNLRFFEPVIVSGSTVYRATAKLLTKMNEILSLAGCGTIANTPLGSGDGIPWTRKSGDEASPTVDTGPVQAGDIIGPWIFNEWWAFLMALDTLYLPDASSVANDMLDEDNSTFDRTTYNRESDPQDPITDPCGALLTAAVTSSSTSGTGFQHRLTIKADLVLSIVGTSGVPSSSIFRSEESTTILISPNLTNGELLIRWAAIEDRSAQYLDFLGLGIAAEKKISHVTTRADDGGSLSMTIGDQADYSDDVNAFCVNPLDIDDDSTQSWEQSFLVGFSALKFAFPDP